jgi:5-methylcytosine-specific restriction endonuclease McrA
MGSVSLYSVSAEGTRAVFFSPTNSRTSTGPSCALSKHLANVGVRLFVCHMTKRFEFTKQEWADLRVLFGHCCARCNAPDTPANPLTADHIVPHSKGGHGRITNIQPLCRACNTSKLDRSNDDYRLHPWGMVPENSRKLKKKHYRIALIRQLLPYFETIPNIDGWAWFWRLTELQTAELRHAVEQFQKGR